MAAKLIRNEKVYELIEARFMTSESWKEVANGYGGYSTVPVQKVAKKGTTEAGAVMTLVSEGVIKMAHKGRTATFMGTVYNWKKSTPIV